MMSRGNGDHATDPGSLKPRASSPAPLAMLGALAVTAGVTAYLAWPARRSSASTRKRQPLIAYLHDHLSGSDTAIRVVQRLGSTHQGAEDGTFFQWEAIEERRRALVARTFSATDPRTE